MASEETGNQIQSLLHVGKCQHTHVHLPLDRKHRPHDLHVWLVSCVFPELLFLTCLTPAFRLLTPWASSLSVQLPCRYFPWPTGSLSQW